MPSIAAHMIVSKLVSKKLNIKDDDYIRGNLLPDISLENNSHHKIKGKYFLIPDLEYIKNNYDLNNMLYLGYYTHILLDYYYLEEFLPKYVTKSNDLFVDGNIYIDYDRMNDKLLKPFSIDINNLENILKNYSIQINKKKLEYNIDCLKKIDLNNPKYIRIEEFEKFLLDVSNKISKEIKMYESKSN